MTKLSFKGKGERASWTLGLIHTGVCVPHMPEVVSSTSLPSLMTFHGMGTCIL